MKFDKKVIGSLEKCYSMAELEKDGKHCFLVAAEKNDPCYLFDEDGNKLETVWEGPGGVMTMLQVPGSDGEFLATRKFYSPNDSKEASIIIATPEEGGKWSTRKLVDAPFVHRFGILNRDGQNWLIVCCLKSDHEFKEDWNHPGAVYAAKLPDSLDAYNDDNQLELTLVKDNLLKNHGYSKVEIDGIERAVVGTENGTLLFTPPAAGSDQWEVEELLKVPSSDSVLIDLDGDGKLELGTIAPFHGNSITIYHLDAHGNYVPAWKYDKPEKLTEMVHGTWAGELNGKPVWVVGWRKGDRSTIVISWDAEKGTFVADELDTATGSANLMHFVNAKGEDVLVSTNREINEIAMYTLKED